MRRFAPLVALLLSACAPARGPIDPAVPLSADKGLVYFYREAHGEAADIAFQVKENGLLIGRLDNGTYFYRYVTPGRQYYAVLPVNPRGAEEAGGQFVQVVAGRAHYVQAIAQEDLNTVRVLVYVKYDKQALPAIRRLQPMEGIE